jgi:hypothetical protein
MKVRATSKAMGDRASHSLHEPGRCGCFPSLNPTRRHFLITLAAALLPSLAYAQQKLGFSVKTSCSFYPGDKIGDAIYNFAPSPDALSIVGRVAGVVGLKPNFEVLQANVPNAAAVIHEQKRYILYSLLFLQKIREQTATDWAGMTILAHEIGHHLNGHTLTDGGSRPALELEADTFAGRAVKLMGGTLDQALAAYQPMPVEGSETHPPKSARLEAVTAGWTAPAQAAVAPEKGQAAPKPPADTPSLGAQAKDGDALAKEIIDGIRAGSTPSSRMSPGLTATMKAEGDRSFARLRTAGPSAAVKQQGRHLAADGNIYYLYDIKSGTESLSCVMGLDDSGILHVFHCD